MIRELRKDWPWVAAIVVLAAVVYQPWGARALPLTDFGTFLPLLDQSQPLWSQMVTITAYYMDEGRLCIFPYLLFVLAGNAFGMWVPGWYWTYFALNAAVIVLGWVVLRRTSVSRPASFLALALWATMSATPEVWIRPTGEPVALIFFLVALYNAVNFSQAGDWRGRVAIIAICSAGIVFSKEMLVVLLPAGWLMSRLAIDGSVWKWAPWTRRDSWLVTAAGAVVVLSMIPIAWVALTAPPGNYAAQFGEATSPFKLVLQRLEIVLIPTMPALAKLARVANDPTWILLLLLPSLIWIRMIAGGLVKGGRRILWPIGIACLWVALGIASYVPWPGGDAFYMVPFAFGAMFGAAHALDAMMAGGRAAKAGVLGVTAILISIASVESNTVVQRYRLRAHLNGGLIDNIARSGDPAYLVAAVRIRPEEERWGWARNLEGFARFATGTKVGQARDLTCDEARRALESTPGMVVVSRERGCGKLSPASVAIEQSTYRAQWPWLWERHVVSDRMYVTRSERATAGTSPRVSSLD